MATPPDDQKNSTDLPAQTSNVRDASSAQSTAGGVSITASPKTASATASPSQNDALTFTGGYSAAAKAEAAKQAEQRNRDIQQFNQELWEMIKRGGGVVKTLNENEKTAITTRRYDQSGVIESRVDERIYITEGLNVGIGSIFKEIKASIIYDDEGNLTIRAGSTQGGFFNKPSAEVAIDTARAVVKMELKLLLKHQDPQLYSILADGKHEKELEAAIQELAVKMPPEDLKQIYSFEIRSANSPNDLIKMIHEMNNPNKPPTLHAQLSNGMCKQYMDFLKGAPITTKTQPPKQITIKELAKPDREALQQFVMQEQERHDAEAKTHKKAAPEEEVKKQKEGVSEAPSRFTPR